MPCLYDSDKMQLCQDLGIPDNKCKILPILLVYLPNLSYMDTHLFMIHIVFMIQIKCSLHSPIFMFYASILIISSFPRFIMLPPFRVSDAQRARSRNTIYQRR